LLLFVKIRVDSWFIFFRYLDTYTPDVGNLAHLWQRFLFQRK